MSNWPLPIASRFETLGEATGEGTTVAAGNGTKGSYATLGTTGFNWTGFFLQIINIGNSLGLIDVAIGGSDLIIVPDLAMHSANSGGNANAEFINFPIAVPTGTEIKVRARSNAAAHSLRAMATGYLQGFTGLPAASRLVNLNTFSGYDPANTASFPASAGANTSPWSELTASTPAQVCGLYIVPVPATDVARTAGRFLVDIGFGAASSEVVRFTLQGGNTGAAVPGPIFGPIADLIPAGTRLAWRARHSTGTNDAIGVAAYGLVS